MIPKCNYLGWCPENIRLRPKRCILPLFSFLSKTEIFWLKSVIMNSRCFSPGMDGLFCLVIPYSVRKIWIKFQLSDNFSRIW